MSQWCSIRNACTWLPVVVATVCVCASLVRWWCFLQTANLVDELLGEFNAWKEDLPKIDALKDSLDSLRSEVG